MTQTERVLSMLRVAGKQGIRSDEFFHCGMPRGAARIRDLRDEGVAIESVREGKYVRYKLANAGVDVGDGPCQGGDAQTASIDSGVEASTSHPPASEAPPGSLTLVPKRASYMDPDFFEAA